MLSFRIIFLVVVLLVSTSLATAIAQKKPVPSRDAQRTAAERIQSVFADEYESNDREVQAKLASQLLGLARTEKEVSAKFTLYREAVRFASQAGDVVTALKATDAMSEDFAVSPTAVKSYALLNLSKVTLADDQAIAAADACTGLVHELVAENDFAQAEKVVGFGLAALRKVRDGQRITVLRELGASIDEVANRYRSVAQHAETLKESPDDPTANLEVGKFECFVKGNWNAGLAHLSKGDNTTLKELANETLKQADDANSQLKIGNGWWRQADDLDGVMKDRVLAYAGSFYKRALPGLTGLSKITAEKRLGDVPAVSGGAIGAPRQKTIDLLELLDAAEDFHPRNKWALAEGMLRCTEGHFVPQVIFPYQPPEEYDISFAFAQPRLRNHVGFIFPNPATDGIFAFKMAPREYGLSSEGDKFVRKFPREILQPNVKYTVVVSVRKAGVQATINGAAVANVQTDFKDLRPDGWLGTRAKDKLGLFCDDPTVFYHVQIREVTGEGAVTRFPKSQ